MAVKFSNASDTRLTHAFWSGEVSQAVGFWFVCHVRWDGGSGEQVPFDIQDGVFGHLNIDYVSSTVVPSVGSSWTAPGAGIWEFIGISVQGATATIYHGLSDGSGGSLASTSGTISTGATNAYLAIGGMQSNTNNWNGDIEGARFGTGTLTAAQMETERRRRVAKGANVLASWPLADSSTVLRDVSGVGTPLTISSGTPTTSTAPGSQTAWGYWPKRKASRGASAGTITGSLNSTLAGASITATAGVRVDGSLSKTLAGATVSATGAVRVDGALSKTLAGATLVGTGTVSGGIVSGALNATLAGATLAGSAGVRVDAAMAATLAGAALLGHAGTVETFFPVFIDGSCKADVSTHGAGTSVSSLGTQTSARIF